jgi:hypothetical protein
MAKSKSKQQSSAPVAQVASAPKRKKVKKPRLTPYLRVMADPWSAELTAAGIPDHNQFPTVVWRERTLTTLTTNSSGNAIFCVKPVPAAHYLEATLSGTAVAVVADSSCANYDSLSTAFTSYRPMAICLKVSYIGAEDAQQGLFWAAQANEQITTSTDISDYQNDRTYVEDTSDNEIAAVYRYHGGSTWISFTNTGLNNDYAVTLIGGTVGLPASSACVRIETLIVFEAQVDPTHMSARTAAPSVVHPIQVDVAANIMHPNAIVQSGKDPVAKLIRNAEKAIEYGAQLNNLWNNMGSITPMIESFGALLM